MSDSESADKSRQSVTINHFHFYGEVGDRFTAFGEYTGNVAANVTASLAAEGRDPWYRRPVGIVVLAVIAGVIVLAAGYYLGMNQSGPAPQQEQQSVPQD